MVNDKQSNSRELYASIVADLANAGPDAVKRFEAYVKILKTDSLTGLLGKDLLLERGNTRLGQAVANKVPLALCIVDLDDFKGVNDTRGFRDATGYAAGNELLEATGILLKQSVRPDVDVGRYGGEEFVIIGYDTNRVEADAIASRLLERMPRYHDGNTLSIGATIRYPVRARTTLQELVAEANTALKVAKGTGKNKVVFYEPGMVAPELPARTN